MRFIKENYIIIGIGLILILSHLDDPFKSDSSKWVSLGGYVGHSVRYASWFISNVMLIKLVLSVMVSMSTVKNSISNWIVNIYISWHVFDILVYLWYGKNSPFNTMEMQGFVLLTFFVPVIYLILKRK